MINKTLIESLLLHTQTNINSDKSEAIANGLAVQETRKKQVNERMLWRSVIAQAIFDGIQAPTNSKTKTEKAQAVAWFSLNNSDFKLVCEMADLNAKLVIFSAKEFFNKHGDCLKKYKLIRLYKEKKVKTQPIVKYREEKLEVENKQAQNF